MRDPRQRSDRDAEIAHALAVVGGETAPWREAWPRARAAYRDGALDAGALACAYVALRLRALAPGRWLQGPLPRALPCASRVPIARLVAERRLLHVSEPVVHALLAWADGARAVELRFDVPSPREILARQARGERCVSLLDDDVPTAPHADGLAFAMHDLCHLEKFVDPAHYHGQVGFFATVHTAMARPAWLEFEAPYDDAVWRDERDHVVADMNGSAIFLLVALKMKLKMATRRRLARLRGHAPPTGGPLSPEEWEAYSEGLEVLLDQLALPPDIRAAAAALSMRAEAHDAAVVVLTYFEALGRATLAGAESTAT